MAPNYLYKAYVESVTDGDTILCIIDVGFNVTTKQRLRLLGSKEGVDTYEKNSKDPNEKQLALAGMEFTKNKVLGKNVLVRTQKSDSFGRYLAEVIYTENNQEFNLGDELLNAKLAVPYKRN